MKIVWSLAVMVIVLTACERSRSPFDTCLMQNTVNLDAPTPARLVIHDFHEPATVRVLVNGETIFDGMLEAADPSTGLNRVEEIELFEFNYVELARSEDAVAACVQVESDVRYVYLSSDSEISSSNADFILLD